MGQFDVFNGGGVAPTPSTKNAFSAFDSVPTDGGPAPGEVEPPPPTTSTFGAAARGFGQSATFGFSDELGGLFGATLNPFSDKSYTTLRDEIRTNNKKAQEEHPIAYGAGEVAGAIAPSVLLPGLGTAAEAAGIGGAEALGRVAAGVAPEGASALKAAQVAAGQGAAYGLGSSDADLTKGDVGGALADTAKGALSAAVTAGVLHKVGSKLATNADDNFLSDVVTETNGKGRPKDQLQARRLILSERDSGPGTAEVPAISSRDVVYSKDLKPILDAAHDDPARAIALAKPLNERLNAAKVPAYQVVEDATGGVKKSDIIDAIDKRIATHAESTGTKGEREMLAAVKKDVDETFKGKDRVPTTKFRESLTTAQNSGIEALGTIAETEHARLRAEGQTVFQQVMDAHLSEAASKSSAATNAVQQIRNINKTQSVVLSIQKGLEAKLAKQQLQKRSIAETVGHGVGDFAKVSGIGDIMAGNVLSGVAKMLAPAALKATAQGARISNEVLARTLYQAQRGNPRAQAIVRALRTSPTVAARLAAMASTSSQGAQ